jgi:PAS domain S-box-containing protein
MEDKMSRQHLRVLLADDDESLREPLAKYLRQMQGYQVDAMADARGALACLEERQGRYEVALIDDLLIPEPGREPEALGVRLIKEIKGRYPDIEIIIFTGWGMDSALEALQAGAYRYLTKPLNFDELEILIQMAAEHNRLKGIAREKQILEQLMQTSAALLSGQSLPDMLDIILLGVQAIGFDRVGLYLLSEDRQRLVGKAQVGMETEFVGHERPLAEDGYMQILLADPRPHIFEREAGQPLPYERELGREGVQQWACVPLILRAEVIGKLSMDNKFSRRPIVEAELGPVALFAAQTAAAIENARLLVKEQQATKEAEWRARTLKAIQEVSTAIGSLMELDKILRATCEAVVELFRVDHSGLVRFSQPDYERGWVLAEYPDLGAYGTEILAQGVPIEEELIASKKPVVLAEISDEASLGPVRDVFNKFNICSILIVPVVVKGEVLGSFSLDTIGRLRQFSDDEVELCQIFANQVAVAIENAYLYEEVARERDHSDWLASQLLALHEITQMIQTELDLPRLLGLISQLAAKLLKADASGILLLDTEKKHLGFKGSYNLGQQIVEDTCDLVGSSIAGRVVENGKPLIVHDAPHDPRFYNPAAEGEGLLAIVSTPLSVGGEIIGTLDVHSKSNPQAFDEDDLQILSLLATQAAIAIQNARLFEQLSEQKDHWARLVASSPNGVISIDRQGYVNGFNDQAQLILKYSAEEAISQSVSLLYDDPLEANQVGKLLHSSPEGKLTDYETFIRSKVGERIPIRLAATWLYDTQGNQIGSVGYFEDLRVIKETEKRLELLLKASNTVAQAENLIDGLQSLAEMIVTFLDISFCRSFLLDESRQCLIAKAVYPTLTSPAQLDWLPESDELLMVGQWPHIAEVLAQGNPKILRVDDEQHRAFLAERSGQLGLKQDVQSLLLIPLKARDRVVGLLALGELRLWEQAPFSPQKQELAAAIADQTAVLIDQIRLYELMDRHRRLLMGLDEASRNIRGEKETSKLLQEVVRLAAELTGCTAGGLYLNWPQLKDLELHVAYELPPALVRTRLSYSEGLVGLVARTGQPQIAHSYSDWSDREDYHFNTLIGVPLKHAGEVEAVLFVADRTDLRHVTPTDLEILSRFAAQASIALQTSRLLSREQRMFERLAILHKISDYIQAAKDLDKIVHVVLTGVTAGYGLSFNRAAVFLLDERQENLIGRMGIGHLDEAKAHQDWEEDLQKGLFDFGQYLKALEEGALPPTPVGERVRRLRLPVRIEEPDLFSQVVLDRRYMLPTQSELDQLPSSFSEAFEPALSLVVVPLIARNQVIGLLVADTKFTRSPITAEDVDLLLTYANTAAIAIDNTQLFHETEVGRERLRAFYEASNALVSSQDPKQVLQDTVEQTRLAAGATGVNLMIIDQMGQARHLITADLKEQFDLRDLLRPNGVSMRVMRSGQPEIFEDTRLPLTGINPSVFWRSVAAALCLPVSLNGERIGVMWLHYDDQPRYFSEAEIEALQLYVNQAAIAYDSARRIKELEYMRQAAEALAGAAGLSEVLEQIVHSAWEVLQADSAVIWSYDASQNQFILERSVATGIPIELWREFQKTGPRRGGTAYTVMKQGWVGVTDLENLQQYEFLGGPTAKLLQQVGARSFQGIALAVGEEKLGVLYVNYNHLHHFSQEERRIAQTFANHAALALKRVKLLDQVSRAHNTARVVAGVTVLENLDDTLNSLVQGTQDALNCDATVLHTYDWNFKRLGYPPIMAGVRYPEKARHLPQVPLNHFIFTLLAESKPYIVENVPIDPILGNRRFSIDEEIESCIAVPLQVGDRKVGIMFINYRQPHHFTDDEITNIELFAHQAAVAIRNAQLYRQVQKRAEALQALQGTGRIVTSSLDLDEILHRIVEQARRLTRYRGKEINFTCIRLVEGMRSWVVATYPPDKLLEAQEACGGEIDLTGRNGRIGIMGRAAITGEPQRVDDVSVDPDYLTCNPETNSELAVPIKLDNKVMGVINVEHSDYDAFDDEDQQALEALAAQAAIAIQNANLFKKTQRHAHLLDAAAQVARGAIAVLDIDKLLNETVRLICMRFDFYHSAVFLLDNEREYAVLLAAYPEDDQRILKPDHKLRVGQEGIVGFVAQAGKPRLALDVSKDPYYIANLPLTQAEMAFPLIARRQVIGVLDVQSHKVGDWQNEDIATLQTMADQLANAIQNAQLYQQVTERLEESRILRQVAVSLAGTVELDGVLNLVMTEAMQLTNTHEALILFWDAKVEEFTQGLKTDRGGTLQPYTSQARKNGYTRMIIKQREPIIISDTHQEAHVNPILIAQGCRAILGVPLLSQGDVTGVLYVRSKEPRQFFERQVVLLRALAGQAAIAIDRARQYEELKRTKGLVGARTALAWMGMADSIWRHATDKHALTIREQTHLLRRNLDQLDPQKQETRIKERLTMIERLANKILEKPLTLPLSAEEGLQLVAVNELVSERARQLWQNDPYRLAELSFDLQLPGTTVVSASPEWLRRAFDILVDNAVEAVAGCEIREVVVGSRSARGGAEIFVADTGPGLPEHIREKIGLEFIEKSEDARGMGMGLLIAQTIVQTYGGEIRVDRTGPTGTVMVIWLPLKK